MIGWVLFFVLGVSLLIARMFIPPAVNQAVKMRRFIVVAISAFILSIFTFILVCDDYAHRICYLKEQEVDLYRKSLVSKRAKDVRIEERIIKLRKEGVSDEEMFNYLKEKNVDGTIYGLSPKAQ